MQLHGVLRLTNCVIINEEKCSIADKKKRLPKLDKITNNVKSTKEEYDKPYICLLSIR